MVRPVPVRRRLPLGAYALIVGSLGALVGLAVIAYLVFSGMQGTTPAPPRAPAGGGGFVSPLP